MGNKKTYWKGLEELNASSKELETHKHEFPEELPVQDFLAEDGVQEASTGRRDFLKFLGFTVSAAALASCETPVNKVIPYVNKPESITPGIANWYASTFFDGTDYGSVLVKTREGRPIHIRGNKHFGLNKGAINARINSSVLSLYDSERLQQPLMGETPVSWSKVDNQVEQKLNSIKAKGGNIRILSNTINSPSTLAAIEEFKKTYGGGADVTTASSSKDEGADTTATMASNSASAGGGADVQHIQYDEVSGSGIRKAHRAGFGVDAIPFYDFSKAKTIVSVAADFLANWLMPTISIAQYNETRHPEGDWMSRHFQFEPTLSLTGSNADVRFPVKPSQEGLVIASIYNHLAAKAGKTKVNVDTKSVDNLTKKTTQELWANKGESLVVAGSNNQSLQLLVNAINDLLGNYGNTLDLDQPLNVKQGDEAEVESLVNDMNAGKVDALIVYGSNPVYSLPNSAAFEKGLGKVEMSISLASYHDETASRCDYTCPDHHYLESWNDQEVRSGHYGLSQPTIGNLYKTRQAQESFLKWAGRDEKYDDFIQKNWKALYKKQNQYGSYNKFWGNSLHNGVFERTPDEKGKTPDFKGDVSSSASEVSGLAKKSTEGFELVLYQKTGIGDGKHTANPWLQELPDPISKVTWDNYITMSPADMKGKYDQRIKEKDFAEMATVSVNGKSIELPVFAQPGQMPGTIGIALGYGRGANGERIGKAAYQVGEYGDFQKDENGNPVPVGKNAYPLASFENGVLEYNVFNVSVTKIEGKQYPLGATQTHHTIMGRDSILRETNLETYLNGNKKDFNKDHTLPVHEDGEQIDQDVNKLNLWEEHPVEGVGHRWGLSIDLSTCIGCSACVVACQSENNVPVVGKDEVRRSREMHWIRIDRYFSSQVDEQIQQGKYDELTHDEMMVPADQPDVTFMPMMCQHCNHAPCETVCPVAATTHSNEGLNQMTYNRCIGTRYCANNCPYKVRRFNWFNYNGYKKFKHRNPTQDEMSRMVLNPDVVVRSRGVMEKCSMCVQRIQAGKLEAKKAGEAVEDGAIQTACSDACPTNAITFGDVNDKDSEVRKEHDGNRGYYALEEIGTRPNVAYQVNVRNRKKEEEGAKA